jgi:glycosyltransferase involved in cell wall biosynthesis
VRIAHFTECYADVINGVSQVVQSLTDSLTELGYDCVIVTASKPAGLPAIHLPSRRIRGVPYYAVLYPRDFLAAYRQIRNERFDLIHVHHPFGMGMLALTYRRHASRHGRDVPIIFHCHSLYDTYAAVYAPSLLRPIIGPLTVTFVRYWLRVLCNRCSCVIAP